MATTTRKKAGKGEALARWRERERGIDWEIQVEAIEWHSNLGPEWMTGRGQKPSKFSAFDVVTLKGRLVEPGSAKHERAELSIYDSDLCLDHSPTELRIGIVQEQRDHWSAALWIHKSMFGNICTWAAAGKIVRARVQSDLLERGFGKARNLFVSSTPKVDEEGETPAVSETG